MRDGLRWGKAAHLRGRMTAVRALILVAVVALTLAMSACGESGSSERASAGDQSTRSANQKEAHDSGQQRGTIPPLCDLLTRDLAQSIAPAVPLADTPVADSSANQEAAVVEQCVWTDGADSVVALNILRPLPTDPQDPVEFVRTLENAIGGQPVPSVGDAATSAGGGDVLWAQNGQILQLTVFQGDPAAAIELAGRIAEDIE